jgi:hypothetical protein
MPTSDIYPLAIGNTWTYKMKDGKTLVNTVTGAHGGLSARHTMAESVAVRNLVKTIRRGDRSDAERLEEDGEGGGWHREETFGV